MDAKALSSAIARFSAKFVNELPADTSVVSSPLSAEYLLALLTLGSEEPAHSELLTALNIPDDNSIRSSFTSVAAKLKEIKGVTLNVANKIYIKEGKYELVQQLKDDAVKIFDAAFEKMDFAKSDASAAAINKWVETKTNNRIKDLISADSLGVDTRLVLVNAIYFKGSWAKQFEARSTRPQSFHVNQNTKIDIPMMYQEAEFKFGASEQLNAQLLEMPYVGNEASMLIILPNEIEGLNGVMKKLAAGHDLMSELDNMSSMKVQVTIPKFKIETTIDLNKLLPQLGIKAIFSPQKSGLTKILDNNEPLFVSTAVQKAFIEVNEEGAEAAAATGSKKHCASELFDPQTKLEASIDDLPTTELFDPQKKQEASIDDLPTTELFDPQKKQEASIDDLPTTELIDPQTKLEASIDDLPTTELIDPQIKLEASIDDLPTTEVFNPQKKQEASIDDLPTTELIDPQTKLEASIDDLPTTELIDPQTKLEASIDDLPTTELIDPQTKLEASIDDLPTTELSTDSSSNLIPTKEYPLPMSDQNITLFDISDTLDHFERKFYNITFLKLLTTTTRQRRENGISFAVSGLFLYLMLLALAPELDHDARQQIEKVTGFTFSESDGSYLIKEIVNSFPAPSEDFKFYWKCRLLHKSQNISKTLDSGPAAALPLHHSRILDIDTPLVISKILNKMVELDSHGAMHNTFEEQDLSDGVTAVILSTVYVRASWRSPPTLLNGSRPFYDTIDSSRTTRMIRINDIIGYANLPELGAEVLEVSYSTPGLSVVMVVPYGRTLRGVAILAGSTGVGNLQQQLTYKRIAVTLPLFTLRMTLLLPKKLQAMGITQLVNTTGYETTDSKMRISHAIQKLMFWSEAGRKAFKDDGIEWDQKPEQEIVIDRPYVFYVRWKNVTLLSGNFVL